MEAARSSEKLEPTIKICKKNIPVDSILHSHYRNSLQSQLGSHK
jgi:hypothetical protein